MSTLGKRGRFGNQLLQYAYLRLYAEACGCEPETADWIGRYLFDLDDPWVSGALPRLEESTFDAAGSIAPGCRPEPNVDLRGFFSFHSSKYAHARNRLRAIFRYSSAVRATLEGGWQILGAQDRTVVAIHLRRGDFGYGKFWIGPLDWYEHWLECAWPGLRNPVLYIATDDVSLVGRFARYQPVHAAMLGQLPAGLEYVWDFYALTRAQVVAVANSTFSFVAAMLNTEALEYVRPDPVAQQMRPFDPWNAPILLEVPEFRPDAPISPHDVNIIGNFIPAEATVFDIGAAGGGWSRLVHGRLTGRGCIHAFEPDPANFAGLSAWANLWAAGSIQAIQAVSGIALSQHLGAQRVLIDDYCRVNGVGHIHFMRNNSQEPLLDVLLGCRTMLAHARIDCIQFEYGSWYREAGARLHDLFIFLESLGYRLLRIGEELTFVHQWREALEDYQRGVFVAVHSRLLPYLGFGERQLPDVPALIAKHGLPVKGLIQVGAHFGEEVEKYRQLGVPSMLMIEANPQVYAALKARIGDAGDVIMVNRAASDVSGMRTFHLALATRLSSLLPLGRHAECYPQIVAAGEIEIQCEPLDDIVEGAGLSHTDYNLLHIDVQGAELMVLKGAQRLLHSIDLISVEVHFAELYAGWPQIDEIDDFLGDHGFDRIEVACPINTASGNAIYLHRRVVQ